MIYCVYLDLVFVEQVGVSCVCIDSNSEQPMNHYVRVPITYTVTNFHNLIFKHNTLTIVPSDTFEWQDSFSICMCVTSIDNHCVQSVT